MRTKDLCDDGTGVADEMECICVSVAAEGGRQLVGFPFSISRETTPLQTNNDSNIYPLFAIRLKSGFLGATINLSSYSINCTSTASYNYYLLLNPTVVDTPLSFTGLTNSAIEFDKTTTSGTTVTGGTILESGATSQQRESGIEGGRINSRFSLGSDYNGVSDVLVLAVQRVNGGSETVYGSLNWIEQK